MFLTLFERVSLFCGYFSFMAGMGSNLNMVMSVALDEMMLGIVT